MPALLWVIPCAIAAAYLSVFLLQLPHHIRQLDWYADYASGFTVPETVSKTGTGGHTTLGPYSLYVPLWFGLLTAKLPLHRYLWEVGPTALFILSALTIGWSVAQIANRRVAALAVLLTIVASPRALSVFMAAVAHNTVYPCTALLGAYLVWLAKGEGRGRAVTLVVPALAAVVLGTCLASDLLLVPTGLAPFCLVAILALLRRERRCRRLALSAIATVVLSLPIALLTPTIMYSLGYRTTSLSLELLPFTSVSLHAQLLFEGLKELFNGYLGAGAPGTLDYQLGVACVVVMAAALLALVVAGIRAVVKFFASGLRADSTTADTQLATSLHVIYWVSSALAACGGFMSSAFFDSTHQSFYATVTFSVAAVVPLVMLTRSPARWLVPLGTSIFFVGSLVGLTVGDVGSAPPPVARYESRILSIAQRYHATAGYAGYWDASSLTWSTHERVAVRPVLTCQNPAGAGLCIFPQETVPSWYIPKRRATFLLIDDTETIVNYLPSGLGRPLAAYSFGAVQMYIYPYDLASRIGPSPV